MHECMHIHGFFMCLHNLQVMSCTVILQDMNNYVPVFRNDVFAANINSNLTCTGREASLGYSLHVMHDSNDAKSSIQPGQMH